LLVETAVQNKFKIKFSRLLSLSKAQFLQWHFCKIDYRSKNAYHIWLEFREEKMLIKPCEF
jgi:hypothetical protein